MKSITIATTLLVVVFSLAVVGFAQTRPEGVGPGMGGRPGGAGFLSAIPDITTEQLAALNDLRDEHIDEMGSVHTEMGALHEALQMEMQKPAPSTATVRKLMTRISEIKIEAQIARLEMRSAGRELLDPEQQEFFDEMMRSIGGHGLGGAGSGGGFGSHRGGPPHGRPSNAGGPPPGVTGR